VASHLTRKELKSDQVAVTVEHTVDYVQAHQRPLIQIVVGVVAASVTARELTGWTASPIGGVAVTRRATGLSAAAGVGIRAALAVADEGIGRRTALPGFIALPGAAASAPAAKSRESPGSIGITISPVSVKMIRNSIA